MRLGKIWPTLPLIDIAIKVGKYVWDKLTHKKQETSEKLGQQEALKEGQETINEVVQINQAFRDLVDSLEMDIDEIERNIINEIAYFFEEFLDYISERKDLLEAQGMRVEKYKRKFERIERKTRGSLKSYISKIISLDNQECREVLAMRAGDKKTSKMSYFIDKSFDTAIAYIIDDLKEALLDITEEMEESIFEAMDQLETRVAKQCSDLKQFEMAQEGSLKEKEAIINHRLATIGVIEEILNHMEGGDENGMAW